MSIPEYVKKMYKNILSNKDSKVRNDNGLYFIGDSKSTTASEVSETAIKIIDPKKDHYIVMGFDKHKRLRFEKEYVGGKLNGRYIRYSQYGNKVHEGTYVDDMKHGQWTKYEPKSASIKVYDMGKLYQ